MSRYAYKNDTTKLVKIAQYIRKKFPNVKVQREWYVCLDPEGKFLRVQDSKPIDCYFRNPDILIFELLPGNKQGKLLCVIEIDGSVHDFKVSRTELRNEQYAIAKIPLIVMNEADLDYQGKNPYKEIHKQLLTTLQNIKSCTVE